MVEAYSVEDIALGASQMQPVNLPILSGWRVSHSMKPELLVPVGLSEFLSLHLATKMHLFLLTWLNIFIAIVMSQS